MLFQLIWWYPIAYLKCIPVPLFLSTSLAATEPKLLSGNGALCYNAITVPIWQINLQKHNKRLSGVERSGGKEVIHPCSSIKKKETEKPENKNNLGFNICPFVWLLNNESRVEQRAKKMNKSELKRQFGESNHWIIIILIKCFEVQYGAISCSLYKEGTFR